MGHGSNSIPPAGAAGSRSRHRRRILTLLTDFGSTDYYVGAVKGTVLRLAPGTLPVDLSHEVAPGDIAAGAFLLKAAAATFPPADTVHLAVVDPGVGGSRRILAAETPAGMVVGPDNGLLAPLLAAGGGEPSGPVVAVTREDLFLPSPGATFHGRDRFAPVAAYLLRGEPLGELGAAVDDPIPLPGEPPRRQAGQLGGRVVHIDRFGNLITDIPAAWLPPGPVEARVAAARAEARPEGGAAEAVARRRADHYAELAAGEAAVLTGSLATLELALNRGDLARRWGVARGARVTVFFPRPAPEP